MSPVDFYMRERDLDLQTLHTGWSIRDCTECVPDLDASGLQQSLQSVNTTIEIICLANGTFFAKGSSQEQYKRAEHVLFNPIEGMAMMLEDMQRYMRNWGTRATYFEACTRYALEAIPPAKENRKSQAKVTAQARSLLYDNGKIDGTYLNSFRVIHEKLELPMIQLQQLLALMTSVVNCANGQPCRIASRRLAEGSTPNEEKETSLAGNSKDASSIYRASPATKLRPQSIKSHDGILRPAREINVTPTSHNPHAHQALPPSIQLPTPYYITYFTNRGHHPSHLSAHSNDALILDAALKLLLRTAGQARALERVCEEGLKAAESVAGEWRFWMDEVSRSEESIERKGRKGIEGQLEEWR